ncbi:hypothetical protein DH2020_003659 [Rehmannia glutinosa]|uniref:Myb/SANT-like domain-containing protein n=1 Tax=Rehmannia glutinosa TaxID=99300 RepID=A0ABR0XM74_REHGL
MGDASHKRKGEDKTCKTTKKKWIPKEDAALIAALSELCNAGWKRETGIFKNGYTSALERKLKSKLPGCNIKASPHIESRLKLLKRQYDAITEMQGAAGMQWDDKDNLLICEDDDVWEEWVQTHTDAKGLRNKQFPYYNDLHVLFGNRGTRKGVNNELDSDKVFVDNDNNATTLMVDDIEEDDRVNYEAFQNGSFDKEVDPRAQNNIYKKRKTQRDIIKNISNSIMLPDHEKASDRSDDSTGTNRSDDENLSADATRQLAKIFGTFLEKYQEHLSLLGEIIGRETAAEKIAGEKRANLNGELTKLPNLNLQARLRAASLIVSDPAKLDLFYSLSKEERREWVSMLLSGLI